MTDLTFTIGDIARLAGVTPKTIRHYHERGLLSEARRGPNNYRLYTVDQLEHLKLILRLKAFGLSLDQIKSIFAADDPDAAAHRVLYLHQQRIRNELSALQQQIDNIQDFLSAKEAITNAAPPVPAHNAMTIVTDAIKP
ncbi:MAG: MerR family transcriptional regulator, partial [Chloroflexota bacterium]